MTTEKIQPLAVLLAEAVDAVCKDYASQFVGIHISKVYEALRGTDVGLFIERIEGIIKKKVFSDYSEWVKESPEGSQCADTLYEESVQLSIIMPHLDSNELLSDNDSFYIDVDLNADLVVTKAMVQHSRL
jgi:hypothetical protein